VLNLSRSLPLLILIAASAAHASPAFQGTWMAADADTPPPPPRGPGFGPGPHRGGKHGPRGEMDPREDDLLPMTVTGKVQAFTTEPHGRIDGILTYTLKDGMLVRVRPTAPNAELTVGSKVRAEGDGTTTFVQADRLTLTATGTVLDFSMPPLARPAPRDLTMLEDSSTVLQVVNNPEGEPDTLVLRDGSIVKLPAKLRDEAGEAIKVGTKLAVRGEGGSYGTVKALRANRLQLASGQIFSEPDQPSPRLRLGTRHASGPCRSAADF
jgi:hypothetical protein